MFLIFMKENNFCFLVNLFAICYLSNIILVLFIVSQVLAFVFSNSYFVVEL